MALQTSPERPAPVRVVASLIGQWVDRLGAVWVEGQVAQVSRRHGAGTVFLTLRDPSADLSLQVTCPARVLEAVVPPLADGARVLVHARPMIYLSRGSLQLAADEIRQLGLGELLARLERLRSMLAAEGLFDAGRKRTLPFLPGTVGLVCGRGSAAEHDVLENARARWPAVRFRLHAVPVQGPYAVPEILTALRTLDADPDVQVVIVARGGGSVEDLLPFSDEALVRAVSRCRTPVVSAIGHETDTPLLDLVADVRASTPTDAAKRVVPDVREQQAGLDAARDRARRALRVRLERERQTLAALRSRPVLAAPHRELDRRGEEVDALRARARRTLGHRLDAAASDVEHVRARVRALSPAATLDRGYAVLQRPDGRVVRAPQDVSAGDVLDARLAAGRLAVTVSGSPDGPVTR